MTDSIIALFCCLDDCARLVEDWERHHLTPSDRQRRRAGTLSLGEMLSIMVLFHISAYKTFKPFRLYGLSQEYGDCFGELPSYSRFVSLKPRLLLPFDLFTCCCIISVGRGPASTLPTVPKLAVCHNAHIRRNRVFQGMAKRGRTTMGWFFGFKLHLRIHHKGQIMAFRITDGSRDDRKLLEDMTAALQGKIFADQGHVSKSLLERLWQRGLHLVTSIRRNMKNDLIPMLDKGLVHKRFIIETLFDKVKSSMGLAHTRHRSPSNPLLHILSSLTAYTLTQPKVNIGNIGIPNTMPSITSSS